MINLQFEHKKFRVPLASMALKETVEEDAVTKAKVFEDRQHQVEAVLVRLMKTNKSMMHDKLYQNTMEALKYPLDISLFKKRINSLIERDYLKRDDDNMNLYHYLA